MEFLKFITSELKSSAQLMLKVAEESAGPIAEVGELLADSLLAGKKVLIFGNGGSAADAQHFAAELAGRYRQERRPLPAIALTTDTSLLTAIGNDFGFSQIFARQVQGLGNPGDIALGISTSGRSANVVAGLQTAQVLGLHTVALIGANILGLAAIADHAISIPSEDTPRIQEIHAVIIHILCDIVEQRLTGGQAQIP